MKVCAIITPVMKNLCSWGKWSKVKYAFPRVASARMKQRPGGNESIWGAKMKLGPLRLCLLELFLKLT